MRRVCVVGMGIVSCLGNSLEQVAAALKAGRSGIEFLPERREMGFRSGLAGTLKDVPAADVPKRIRNQMGLNSQLAVPAVRQAIAAAGIEDAELRDERTGIVIGNSGNMHDVFENCHGFGKESKKLGGNALQRTMNSSVSANLSVWLGTRGNCMTVAGACASGAAAIGQAYQLIQSGYQDRMICGGVQEGSWEYDCNFDALRAFSAREDDPTRASRPFDRDRDGLVPSAGCGIVVLEEYEQAVDRNAHILAEVVGFATNSDGHDMTVPSGVGSKRCMELALTSAGIEASEVDYVNAHATSTRVGDVAEAQAIAAVFGEGPLVSSTKSMTGHEIGAAGSNEFIYSLLMMQDNFIAPTINLDHLDDECRGIRIVANDAIDAEARIMMSNSFGFGGVNTCLIVKRPD